MLGGSAGMLVCVLLLMVVVVIPCFVIKLRKSPSLAKKSSLDGKPCLDVHVYLPAHSDTLTSDLGVPYTLR